MSVPMFVLTIGASAGIGAVSVPALASALSKPLTGEIVPTRITDLAGYLTLSGDKPRGFSGDSSSFEDPTAADGQGQSIGLPSGVTASPLTPAPSAAPKGGATPPTATNDKKRILAAASFAGGLAVAGLAFLLIRRVTS